MRVAVVALVGGLILGVARGGRLANIPTGHFRWPSLSLVAVVLYLAPSLLDASASASVALVLFSYLALLAFALGNLRFAGMAIVALGLAANAAVITANEGMPVDPQAVVAAGIADPEETIMIEFGTARRWQEADDRLSLLGDMVPITILGEVVSFGDLILAAGMANVAFRLLSPSAASRRAAAGTRRRQAPAHAASG